MESPTVGGLVASACAQPDTGTLVDGGFLLSRAGRTLRTSGSAGRFSDAAAAAEALRGGGADLVVGALPFDPRGRAALTVPREAFRTSGPWAPSDVPAPPPVRIVGEMPRPGEHLDRVAALIERVRSGELEKVVAARSIVLASEEPISPHGLLSRLVQQDPAGNGFAVDLTPAGGDHEGRALVGSSPEILIRREGMTVSCWPLAGSAPRSDDPVADEEEAARLLASVKNRHEHAFVVDWLRERLSPLCAELTIAPEPSLLSTPDLWHLGTPIRGVLADPGTLSLDLAVTLHPTPAVCGTPADAAMRAITELEEERGFYAGAVGWCDASGDGEWMVAIRCAEISADRKRARAFAGGGIVAGSDPEGELAETTTKLRTLLTALGVLDR